jgi:hypothetical protein
MGFKFIMIIFERKGGNWIKRLEIELADLTLKIEQLNCFVHKIRIDELSDFISLSQKDLLIDQLECMKKYKDILEKRLEDIDNNSDYY